MPSASFVLEFGSSLYAVSAEHDAASGGGGEDAGPVSFSLKKAMPGDAPGPRVRVDAQAGNFSLPGASKLRALKDMLDDGSFWRSLEGEGARLLASIARRVERELSGNLPGSETLASAYALEFLVVASRLARPWHPPEGVWSVADAKRYVEERYAEQFCLDFFTAKCAMNTSDFSRRFKELAGCPLFEYLNRQRIARACVLLKSTRLGVLEIAERVGYNNLSFFNRYFQRIMGASPRSYRS